MHHSNHKLLIQKLKTLISSISEIHANKILQKFIQLSNQQIEHYSNQISYKCFESVCTINNRKITGYGRTQTQAMASSIKNLFEYLVDQEKYVDIIGQSINKMIKIEENDDYRQNLSSLQIIKKKSTKKKGLDNLMNKQNFDNFQTNDEYLKTKSKSEIQKSINNNNKNSLYFEQKTELEIDKQIRKKNEYIRQLQKKLRNINQQNNIIKQLIQRNQNIKDIKFKSYKLPFSDQNINKTVLNITQINDSNQASLNKSVAYQQKRKNAAKVPRLKLQVLPNYHGKSNKCLNDILLASYQQKYGLAKHY